MLKGLKQMEIRLEANVGWHSPYSEVRAEGLPQARQEVGDWMQLKRHKAGKCSSSPSVSTA